MFFSYPGKLTGGTIPRLFVLPPSEENSNAANFYAAINRQGHNRLASRV
ncbi:hypothetical protein Q0590_01795 [Rhodocytophaga aerolata]|uniref:Uncharacterized protein n=1 Tax=Rhodocytophaga aerolata TaxID=455078 RepID=A0ABT8QYP8_9BACT|nr:hypothetical protein [Rhodocytophaga aerolata]MDO1444960.1 hypothetical protein [Rhodocytophaga aerolata]